MPIKFDDNEIDQMERDAQQENLMAALLQFIETVKSGESEKAIIKALNDNSGKVQTFAEAVRGLKFEVPKQDEVVKSLDQIRSGIDQLQLSNEALINEIKKLNETNKADRVFKVKYGPMQRIESVTASIE